MTLLFRNGVYIVHTHEEDHWKVTLNRSPFFRWRENSNIQNFVEFSGILRNFAVYCGPFRIFEKFYGISQIIAKYCGFCGILLNSDARFARILVFAFSLFNPRFSLKLMCHVCKLFHKKSRNSRHIACFLFYSRWWWRICFSTTL